MLPSCTSAAESLLCDILPGGVAYHLEKWQGEAGTLLCLTIPAPSGFSAPFPAGTLPSDSPPTGPSYSTLPASVASPAVEASPVQARASRSEMHVCVVPLSRPVIIAGDKRDRVHTVSMHFCGWSGEDCKEISVIWMEVEGGRGGLLEERERGGRG